MPSTTYAGIDYGLGQSNIDIVTGIRYGVIPQGEILQAWCDSSESIYPDPSCPNCSDPVHDIDINDDNFYACTRCMKLFDAVDAECCEPTSHQYQEEGYIASQGQDSPDIFITLSPYYTRAQFCSPCAPGAGYLMNPCDDGPKVYCLGHDWFENGKAPYRVYRVTDDSEVFPEKGGESNASSK